jgi:hypothetical protein
MATSVQVTFDCHEPERLAMFWAAALGYQKQEWDPAYLQKLLDAGLDPSELGSRAACFDPAGVGSRLYFQRVPESKTAKNRVHLDLNVGTQRIEEEIERLTALGANVLRRGDESMGEFREIWAVLEDPEGNEFCLQ